MIANTKILIKDYKQAKKDLRLIERLIKNKKFRKTWCEEHKYNIEDLTDSRLEIDYKFQCNLLLHLSVYVKE
jgi:hypothetical protein